MFVCYLSQTKEIKQCFSTQYNSKQTFLLNLCLFTDKNWRESKFIIFMNAKMWMNIIINHT